MGEELYELPQGWVWAFLSELGELNRGKSKHRPRDDAKLYGGKYPFIQTGDVRNSNSVIKTYTQTYSELGLTQSKLWDKDTLCITIAANIAETALLGISACFPDSIVGFIADNRICSVHYIHYFIKSIKTKLDSYAPATAQKNINLNILRIVSVPLPPLSEQHRIVAKIEELFTQLDAGVELLKKVKAKLKRYRQAVLKAAVEGELTAYWRTAHQGELEPASVLLDRILKQRREKWEAEQLAKMKAQGKTPKDDSWKLKYKEPVAPDVSDLPDLPHGWCWVTLPQIGELNRGKSKHRPRNDPKLYGGQYPFIQTGDVRSANGVIHSYTQTYSDEGLKQSRLWSKGTLCITIAANIAETAILGFDACFPDSIVGFISESNYCDIKWIEFFIRTAKDNLERYAPATAQKNINLEILSDLAVPLPSLEEQNKIVEQLELIFSVADQLEKTIDTNLKRADKLRQTILKQAFEGKLVPQDPSDEPAEKLLERIQAEKAKQVTTKTKKKTKSEPKSSTQLALQLE
ncbi:MAG: restriction endonuclease subunit S [Nostoc sp. ChiQUE01a]|nr:restriction endonuclease subunit S [Nostoc sp. ChiQUE01a]